ncbi:MAG: TonB-dependent receptor [Labilibaculum sp.]|nr:TonB-dependent receptor [Labilibaculum sp.]
MKKKRMPDQTGWVQKSFLTMGLSVLMILSCLFQVSASTNLRTSKLSIKLEEASIREVFKTIKEQSEFTFVYNIDDLEDFKAIDCEFLHSTVEEILDHCLKETNMSYKIRGKVIVIVPKEELENNKKTITTQEQKKTITGTVTDENGEPLPGVSVVVKGTTLGVITDIDGDFSIEAPVSVESLTFSFIGMKSQEVLVNEQSIVSIQLQQDIAMLGEVVVRIGYGFQKKIKLTGAIAQASLGEIQDFPTSNFDQALAGKLAGVQVLQTTGEPGRELDIRIRGTGTITAGASPLYVVDGVPVESSGQVTEVVNMEDIESIQILKDASSASIYGSRGGNGVVLISTKKGKQGEMKVNFNSSYGIQSVSKKIDMMNAYEYAQLSKDGHDAAYLFEVPTGSADDPNSIRTKGYYKTPEELLPYLNGEAGLTDTDWQDAIFRSATIERYNLSVSGGDEKWNYFVSANHSFQEGIVINSDYRKTGIRANINLTSGKFKVGLNLSPSYTFENRVNASGPYFDDGIVASALKMSPTWSVYNEDGTYNFRGNGLWRLGTDYQHNEILNPVALANEITNEIEHFNLFGNLFVEYEVLKDLKLKSSFGFKYNEYQGEYYRPSSLQKRGVNFYNQLSNPAARISTTNIYDWVLENTVNYKKEINLHHFDILGGVTAQKNRRNLQRSENEVTPDIVSSTNAAQVLNTPSENSDIDISKSEWSLYSFLARVQYDFDSKYLLSASYRADASSRFGKDTKWGYFPSVSAGWRISQEDFLKSTDWLSELKVRTSFGYTGNFNIGNYEHISTLNSDQYVTGSSLQIGLKPEKIANANIGWETTSMFNIGIDVDLFKHQLGFTMEYYDSNTKDLLLEVPVPLVTGFSRSLQNIGEVNNKGFEFSVKVSPDLGEFKWTSNFNIAANRNKVVALGPKNADIITSSGTGHAYFITRIGEAVGSYYVLVQDGIFSTQAELDQYPHFGNAEVGDFRFVDVDGDGVLDVNKDRAIVGNYQPDFTYGFFNSFRYKGFDLNIALQGSYGSEILNLQRRYIANGEGNFNNTRELLNRWRSEANPGDGNTNRANRKSKGNNGRTSTWHIEDGSYLRLQSISLGYTLPQRIVEKIKFSKIRVFATGNNLYTWTNYSGFNPEVNREGNQLTPGLDYGTYPLATTISLGINLSF